MSTRFLPRQVGSIETGPQLFAGTEISNTTFYFTEPLDLLNSVLVSNCGLFTLNGIFVYTSTYNNRPYYNKDGNGNLFLVYNNSEWEIYDFGESESPIYFSESTNSNYPWNVINWNASPGYEPVPTVTKIL